jgi:CDP-diacylglycerol--glycerol-3-phosphate 3-phosphatidyltransferase
MAEAIGTIERRQPAFPLGDPGPGPLFFVVARVAGRRPFQMNLPNKLTLLRFGLTAVLALVLQADLPLTCTAGLLLFGFASLTDYADGAIARSRNLITDFGALMDPLADKILTATGLICLAALDYNGRPAVPAWVAIVIISREFLITGLRQLAAAKGVVLSSDRFGKHKTIWQIIMILYFLLLLSLAEWERQGWVPALPFQEMLWKPLGSVLLSLAVVLTVGSGLSYLWKNRHLIADR